METSAASTSVASGRSAAPRLLSLDALRGFDMLWIVGADALGGAFSKLRGAGWLAHQLEHAEWEGFTFYDLIFPLFIFMIGVAITFSLGRLIAEEGRAGALRRVFRRAAVMYVLGLLYYGGFSTPLEQFRLLGVLQRLALCYFFAGLLFIYLSPRALVAACVGLLAGYWALLTFVPVPVYGPGDYAERHNLANYVDSLWLPGRRHNGSYDVEGLLSTLPAIASCLLGVFAGRWLREGPAEGTRKAAGLAAAGVVVLALGECWGLQFPVVKRIWTSSYVLVAGGWSALLLAAFYWVIDVRQHRAWAMPFVWVGMNALTIYLVSRLIDFKWLASVFAGGDISRLFDALWPGLGGVVRALVGIVICFALCRFLYERRIFLRL